MGNNYSHSDYLSCNYCFTFDQKKRSIYNAETGLPFITMIGYKEDIIGRRFNMWLDNLGMTFCEILNCSPSPYVCYKRQPTKVVDEIFSHTENLIYFNFPPIPVAKIWEATGFSPTSFLAGFTKSLNKISILDTFYIVKRAKEGSQDVYNEN